MKKFFTSCLLVFAISLFSLHAEGWQKTLGAGIGFPFGFFTGDGESVDDKQTQFDLNYIAIREANKLAVKLNFGIGPNRSDKLDLDGLAGLKTSLAIGYAPILNEKTTIAILGNVGFLLSDYETETKVSGTKITSSAYFRIGIIGADVFGQYRFNNHLGFYTNLGFYMPFCGYLKTKSESGDRYSGKTVYYDNKISLNGLIIAPSFGLSWTF